MKTECNEKVKIAKQFQRISIAVVVVVIFDTCIAVVVVVVVC